ncbi:DUF4197 family protein [Salinisphaera sp. LB1]|uniref:DUF4197 family protein n=1 Tax=Salinisphaera sp. LB1 TaxID=2183911 RepID=UPI000D7080D4|nr:DUF4197 family protein [Salinisphaera sp. LB1]AWN15913.1 hypothetical protein SALB1_1715 [Salinisphaera sp. LB1]
MRCFAIGLLASSLLTFVTGAQASGLGARMERAMAAPPPESTSRTRRVGRDDMASGLKCILTDGASAAALELGAPGGFGPHRPLGRLPAMHGPAGQDIRVAHIASAAENTASQAGPVLREAINALHIPDPQVLLEHGAPAATTFLADHASQYLRCALAPIAARAYAMVTRAPWRQIESKTSAPNSLLADHIASQTVDALLDAMARQEYLIRRGPAAHAGPQQARIFG